jgi:hypothetical protein
MTEVFNHRWVGKLNALVDFLLAWKKMEELELPGLVVTGNNAVHILQ